MKKRIQAFFMTFVMVVTFAVSFLENVAMVSASELKEVKISNKGYSMTTQPNSTMVPGFAFFSDNLRDGLKGSVFNNTEKGYVSGANNLEGLIEDCFLGSSGNWCTTPAQTINYASCHDNNTLYDRLQLSCPDASQEDLIYADVVDYYKGLIAFRKAHPVLRLTAAEDVAKHMSVVDMEDANVTAFSVTGGVEGETADAMYIVFNPNNEAKEITLPEGEWHVCINGETAGVESLKKVSNTATVDAISALVLVQGGVAESTGSGSRNGNAMELAACLGVAGAVIATSVMKKRKR